MEEITVCEAEDTTATSHVRHLQFQSISRFWTTLYDNRGLLAAFLACVCSGLQNVLVKHLQGKLPVTEVLCIRFIIQGTLSFVCGLPSNLSFRPNSRNELALLIVRAVAGTVGVGCQYLAVYKTAAGTMTSITHSSPIFVGILAWIFFREKVYIFDVLLIATDIVGLVLIAQPPYLFPAEYFDNEKQTELVGVALSIVAMFISASMFIVVRQLGLMGATTTKIVLYYSLVGSVLPSILGYAMGDWVTPPCGWVRIIVVAVGILSFGAQSLVTYALSVAKQTYYVTIIFSLQIPVAIILEAVMLAYIPNWASSIGTVIILSCGFGVVCRQRVVFQKQIRKNAERADEASSEV